MTFFSDNTCCECRGEFGEYEGVFDTPLGAMCEECYGDFTSAPSREREWDARRMWEYYNSVEIGGWGSEY